MIRYSHLLECYLFCILLVCRSIQSKGYKKQISILKPNIDYIKGTNFEEGVGSPHLFDPMDGQKPILR